MVLKITKETWGKWGITTLKHYNKKKDIIELWNKRSDIEIQLGHSNIYDIALEKFKSIMEKKTKNITEKEKKYKSFFKDKNGIFIIEKLTRDITECCKLPKAIELRKKIRI